VEYLEPFIISTLSSISTVGTLGIVAFISRSWIMERLKSSIKHEYDLRILEIESQKEIRLKGEVVAELLAEWIRRSGKHDYHLLNKLSFQAYIWLPKELAEDLSNSLAKNENAKDVRALLKEIRSYLHGEDDGLASKHVIVFDEPDFYGGAFPSSQVVSQAKVKPKPHK
tara:strand:- start:6403 stop:6909 length:507 start_codon:yes stop_codon:yes gene_type:complete